MVWTLVLFGVSHVHPLQGRVPAHRRGARQAPEGDRGVDRHGRAHAQGGRRAARGVPRAPDRRAPAGRRDRRPRAQGRRAAGGRRASARASERREELLEQARKDIETETRRAIQEIRAEVADLTILATEKVTRKTLTDDDQRRLVEEAVAELDFAALSGARSASADGGDRRRLRPLAVRGRARRGQARRRPRAARRVRRRARRRAASCRCSSSRPTSPRGEEGRAAARGRRGGADLPQLPRAAAGEPPHAGDLPHPARVRAAVGGATTGSCRSRSPPRSSSTRRP